MRVLPASLAQERWARAAWSRVAEPGDSRAARLVEELGPVDALAAVVEGRPWAPEPLRLRVAGVDLDQAVGIARRRGVVGHRLFEAEDAQGAVDVEGGEHQEDDQRRLRPVPEAFEALEDIDSFGHFQLLSACER